MDARCCICKSEVQNSTDMPLIYGHCKRSGHYKSRCFEIIGYPEHWKNRGGGRAGHGRGQGNGNHGGRGAMANAVQGRTGVVIEELGTSNNTVQMPSLAQGPINVNVRYM